MSSIKRIPCQLESSSPHQKRRMSPGRCGLQRKGGCIAKCARKEASRETYYTRSNRINYLSTLYAILTVFLLAFPVAKCQTALFTCDFEYDFCRMVNDPNDTPSSRAFDWLRETGRTPTSDNDPVPRTGPEAAYNGQYYMYAEGSDPQQYNDVAIITTPAIAFTGLACIRFYFNMNGPSDDNGQRHMGNLDLYVDRYITGQSNAVWGRSGHQGPDWIAAQQEISLENYYDTISWRATRGQDFKSDIAVDNIQITSGSCSVYLPYTCSFESTMICGMTQSTSDNFDWTRGTGDTPTTVTGPNSAYSGSWYMFIETSDPRREGDAAILETPTILSNGDACLEFYYHMEGVNINYLQVYTSNQGRNNAWWTTYGNKGDFWNHGQVDLRLSNGNDKINFVAGRGNGIYGDIAIDNIIIKSGQCQGNPGTVEELTALPFSCSFEFDVCGMTQRQDDQFDWERKSGSTETAETGPSSADRGSYYVFAESSTPRAPNDRAVLETPGFKYTGNICIHFRYHMYGLDMGTLQVVVPNRVTLLSVSGNQGNQWIERNIDYYINSGDLISFQAVRGPSYRSDIALDDLQITTGTCTTPIQPTTTDPAVTINDQFSCDFERQATTTSSCRVRQDFGDQFDWTRRSGKTPTGVNFDRRINGQRFPVTGPERAQQGSYYTYIEASGTQNGMVARMFFEGSDFSRGGRYCLRFYYSMNGFHTGSLRVFQNVGQGRVTRWTLYGDQLNGWHRAAVDLNQDNAVEVGIEGEVKGVFSGDIAVDDVQMVPGMCTSVPSPYLWLCNFETNDGSATLCDMEQDTRYDTYNFDWSLWSGSTPSSITGPNRAHNGEYYIFIEASKPRQQGDSAIIFVPSLPYSGTICVEFWWHMFGFHIGSLRLITREGSNTDIERWSLAGEQGDFWRQQRVTVQDFRNYQKVGFRGVRGGEYSGDIAIDNIQIRPGSC